MLLHSEPKDKNGTIKVYNKRLMHNVQKEKNFFQIFLRRGLNP